MLDKGNVVNPTTDISSSRKRSSMALTYVFFFTLVLLASTWNYFSSLQAQIWLPKFTEIVPSSLRVDQRPKVHFRTYSNGGVFEAAKKRICQKANETGWFDTIVGHGPEDLPPSFVEQYRDILALGRGGGYWIWKFQIIEMALEQMEEGDMLVYADAGCTLNHPGGEQRLYEYLDLLQQSPFDIISMPMPAVPEFQFTTEHIFRAFQVEASDESIRSSGQYFATFLFMKKGNHLRQVLDLVNAVLTEDPFLITDHYNAEALLLNSSFIDNRHEQSLLSVSRKFLGSIVIEDDPPQAQCPIWQSRLND